MADRPLGPKQLACLRNFVRLGLVGLVPDAVARSLIKRGLFRSDEAGSYCISAAGLRAIADAMDAGKVEDGLTWFARQRAEAEARRDA